MQTPEKSEIVSLVKVAAAIADAVKEAGPSGIPNGHLYAALMSIVPLDGYTKLIRMLVDNGILSETNHVLTYLHA